MNVVIEVYYELINNIIKANESEQPYNIYTKCKNIIKDLNLDNTVYEKIIQYITYKLEI